MDNILERFRKFESDFELYLISDRKEFLSTRYSIDINSLSLPFIERYFSKISKDLLKKSKSLDVFVESIRKRNIPSIFACLCNKEIDKMEADTICKQFLDLNVGTLEEILKCLAIENVFHSLHYSHEVPMASEYDQFKEKFKHIIKEIIAALSGCLSFSNKNVRGNRELFETVKKNQPDTFYLISDLRIIGYIMRSYFNLLLNRMIPYYLKDEDNLIKSLNDLNKALSILERDFKLCEIINETDGVTIIGLLTEHKWRSFAHIAINIIKGHMFYEVKNNSKALDSFCDAIRFYNKISDALKVRNKSQDIAICELFIGKIFGEKGLLLDSLIWHLQALYDFSELSAGIPKQEKQKINDSIAFLKDEKMKDVINKAGVYSFLNDINPKVFNIRADKNWIKGYKSDLLCRIGYSLYILLWKSAEKTHIKKIAGWFKTSLALNRYNSLAVQNLYLTSSTAIKTERIGEILRDHKIEVSRKINFWSMYRLNETQKLSRIIPKEQSIKNEILRSLLTSLDNILTTPQIFNRKITLKKKVDKENINKLLILKRWNSFTPAIPRPIDFSRHSGGTYSHGINRFPGGGYFLIWNKKGIVIDPGFDFIRNLYSAGYTVADVNAIFVTHSHIDHVNDFFSLLTLIYERKDIQKIKNTEDPDNKIDLFLSLGALNSFLPWISAQTKETVNHIYSLPRSSKINDSSKCMLHLKDYHLKVEVIPAIHNEILSDDWAVGLKFYLTMENEKDFVIGITSDTSFYDTLFDEYKESDILITHLGDINFKELIEFSGIDLQPQLFLDCVQTSSDPKELYRLKELAVSLGVKSCKLRDVTDIHGVYKLILEPQMNDPSDRQNHLGFKGINSLAKKMTSLSSEKGSSRIFIITEFPEYLGSFRKRIAESLNKYFNAKHCFTGDINLQIMIDCENDQKLCKVLCNKCARDNDILPSEAFHKMSDIQETCVKASDECIVYYCKEHMIDADKNFINKITF